MKLSRSDAAIHLPTGEGSVAQLSAERIRPVEAVRSAENDAGASAQESGDKRPMAELAEQASALSTAQRLAEQLVAMGATAERLIHPEALHNPALHVLDDNA